MPAERFTFQVLVKVKINTADDLASLFYLQFYDFLTKVIHGFYTKRYKLSAYFSALIRVKGNNINTKLTVRFLKLPASIRKHIFEFAFRLRVLKKHIPNFLTCLNLFCGCIATVMIAKNDLDHLEWAAFLVFAASIFDFLDGFAARMLKIHSPIGKDLDSLADVVTFGLVPGAILFRLLQMSDPSIMNMDASVHRFFQFFPFIITIFSALRLARFNNDTRQSESFIGLPVPANTLFIVSLPLIIQHDNFHLSSLILNPYFIVILSVTLSFLMVSELPLFSLKFKSFDWKKNKYQFILLGSSVIFIFVFFYAGIPLIILLYLLLSFIKNLTKQRV